MRIAVITDSFLENEKKLLSRGSVIQLFNLMTECKKKYSVDFVVYQMGVIDKVCFYQGIKVIVLKCSSLDEYIELLKTKNIKCDLIHFNNIDCYYLGKCRVSTATIHTNAFLENNNQLIYEISKHITKLFVVNREYLKIYNDVENMVVIPNGIDVEFFKNIKVKKRNKKIFFPNIPSFKKNADFAYELIKKLGGDYKLYIPENKFVTDMNIKFLGRGISKNKMRKIYNKCYYVIIPSLSESCSLCSLEAMAMKNYIIANDTIGIKDYVKYDLKSINDINDWVNCIKNVDENLVNMYIEENYKTLINNYTLELMAKKYYEIWKEEVYKNEGNCDK